MQVSPTFFWAVQSLVLLSQKVSGTQSEAVSQEPPA